MPCSSNPIEILVEPDAVRRRFGARGVTGECLGKDEKDVRDERLEYVVSLLVYGLGDVLMVSRVEGRLRRLRDGVTGEEGVEGIVLKFEAGGGHKLDVATSLCVTLLLQLIQAVSGSHVPLLHMIEFKIPRKILSANRQMIGRETFVEATQWAWQGLR
jgi:hypothetical protein